MRFTFASTAIYLLGILRFSSLSLQMFLTKKMGGDVNAIETFLKVTTPPGVGGPTINFATYQSAIYGFAHAGELKPIRKKLFPERLPKMEPRLKPRSALHYNDLVRKSASFSESHSIKCSSGEVALPLLFRGRFLRPFSSSEFW